MDDAHDVLPDPDAAPREACGLVAVYGHPHANAVLRDGLFALQHRGQEGAGLVVSDGATIRSIKGQGLLQEVVHKENFDGLAGHIGVGHVRYSTTGASRIQNVQPLVGECVDGLWAVAHNGNLVNADELRRRYQEAGALFQTGTDSEVLLHLLADAKYRKRDDRVVAALNELRGAFSFVMMNRRQIIAARDPFGFRPLSIGRLGDAYVIASETCALRQVGATYERDVESGEVLFIDENGPTSVWLDEKPAHHAHCVFELVYFARPDSHVFHQSVHGARLRHGMRLAEEHPVDADCVVPVPDSGNFAALGFSRQSGIPLDFGFIRNHYVGRTFIMPGQDLRMALADRKLSVLPNALEGKRVVVVDDSLVRGTTMQRRVRALRAAGAAEVHLRVASPPVAHPCHFGVDFPTREELAASSRTVDGIRDMVGADSLGYLSVDGLVSPLPTRDGFCRACFTGDYPIERGLSCKSALETHWSGNDPV